MDKERVRGFDLVRVLAIFVVIGLYHNFCYAGLSLFTNACMLSLVYSSLGSFTFISAFLLSSRYRFDGRKDILSFYKRRIIRIWPLFAISSVALYIIRFNPLLPTIKGLVGVSPFWSPAPITMWYVAMLLSLYLITPFVASGDFEGQILKAVLIMTVVGIIQLVFKTVVPKTFNYYMVYLVGLIFGRNYYDATMSFLHSKAATFLSIIWIALMIIVYVKGNPWVKSITGVLGIVALISTCLHISSLYRANIWIDKVVSILAYASFCAYLYHREIIWALLRFYSVNSGWPLFLEILLIGVPLTFIVSYIIQRVYDGLLKIITND